MTTNQHRSMRRSDVRWQHMEQPQSRAERSYFSHIFSSKNDVKVESLELLNCFTSR